MKQRSAQGKINFAALGIWILAILAYIIAIANRSSFSVLGSTAQHHFGVEATLLSVFLVAQIAVYTCMQVPVGVMVDRYGATKMICSGLFIMSMGQLLMAHADSVVLGFAARMLVGVGDASIFVSMLRIVADWFPPKIVPIISQISALSAQSGQFISIVPLAAVVSGYGWSVGFTALAVVTLLVLAFCLIWLRDSTMHTSITGKIFRRKRTIPMSVVTAVTQGAQVWDSPIGKIAPPTEAVPVLGADGMGVFRAIKFLLSRPGIRLGFWIHFGSASGMHCFLLLWGSAFVTGGQGRTASEAALVLGATLISSVIGGICVGYLQVRFMRRRIIIALGYIIVFAFVWSVVLLWQGGPAPMWMLIILACFVGWGGPMAMFGFDIARTHIDPKQIGIATGLTNTGAFVGALLMILGIGLLLDLQGAGSPDTYTQGAFNVAMSWYVAVLLFSVVMVLWEYPRAKRQLVKRMRALQGDN
ncbi:MFS transporter [Canibacter sp. lx-45]|uniref:MFS transporter n=1 Tax=Canibacter zhuwentaonis TaxID=2837491 RepID=UPI001BDD1A1E|nr:MFS transporter [Canibacter zhuwentaonis]